jgi:diadenosine tetraphosphate (Ap4A) HIT family hydrolase
MVEFKLNEILEKETYPLLEDDRFIIRLSKNALFPWIIIIPKDKKIEFFQLEHHLQVETLTLINKYSNFLKTVIGVDKINIASIGNIVSQLHIHIVGRYFNDPCFPNPVWGCEEFREYEELELENLIKKFEIIDPAFEEI